jgi:hypothetical protein
MLKFAQKQMEEQDAKESLARQQALEKRGITEEFNYADHAEIFKYADHAVEAQIEIVDAPPEITIEKLDASHILPPEIMDPSNLALSVSARPAVRISTMLASQ